jgi:hypothetical protein
VQNGGFCGIELLHRTQVWRRHHAWASWLGFRISGVEPYASAGSTTFFILLFRSDLLPRQSLSPALL